ncbi:threonine/serine dehydratase [uncultured Desulfosarcina sp.]|uniref:threonine/serine dehydratase n=1 Tax=uncultured Desulfosarcina sp. TaxID=218289 RepID=UPI0029C6C158|nr:threonine/serine dehydratase [uncultured Desulfosarcina sp.]
MHAIRELALAAEKRIRPHIRRTPLEPAADLGCENGGRVYLKLESMQHTGSFKVRGALNRLLALDESEVRAGVVTASSGNHGLATAFGMNRLGIDGAIYLPETASPLKIRMLKDLGAAVRFHGTDCDHTEAFARRQAEETGKVYISPYNDPYVVGGQGTIGLEILDRLDKVDCILASVGGGGLIAGIAGAVKAVRPETTIIGCLPENSPAMAASVQAGRIMDAPMKETLSDGTAGGIEPGAVTFEACTRLVDRWQLVSEKEIRRAMVRVFEEHRLVIEGAAAVTVAGFLKLAPRLAGKTTVIVICGRNIDTAVFKGIVCPAADLQPVFR